MSTYNCLTCNDYTTTDGRNTIKHALAAHGVDAGALEPTEETHTLTSTYTAEGFRFSVVSLLDADVAARARARQRTRSRTASAAAKL